MLAADEAKWQCICMQHAGTGLGGPVHCNLAMRTVLSNHQCELAAASFTQCWVELQLCAVESDRYETWLPLSAALDSVFERSAWSCWFWPIVVVLSRSQHASLCDYGSTYRSNGSPPHLTLCSDMAPLYCHDRTMPCMYYQHSIHVTSSHAMQPKCQKLGSEQLGPCALFPCAT